MVLQPLQKWVAAITEAVKKAFLPPERKLPSGDDPFDFSCCTSLSLDL
jgi:hypothetical protein